MITVMIKGPKRIAEPALAKRAIPGQEFREVKSNLNTTLTVVKVADEYLPAVTNWFGELAAAPYAVGTLVLFARKVEEA